MVGDRLLPDFDESSIAAVHLLHGVVYLDDSKVWDLVLSNQTRLDTYFGRIGLRLVVDTAEGFAFVRQLDDDELNDVPGYDQLPKLFHKKRMSYDATLACVLLREELRRFEDEEVDNSRCVVSTTDLFEQWKPFFPADHNDVKLKRMLDSALATLEELKFVRLFTNEPEEWEIRRIIKARVPIASLEQLWNELKSASDRRQSHHSNGPVQ